MKIKSFISACAVSVLIAGSYSAASSADEAAERAAAVQESADATAAELAAFISPAALGDLGADLVFTPVVPCRIFDTRFDTDPNVPGGSPGYVNNYQVHGSAATLAPQGHTAGTGCAAPSGEPVGIAANFTVVPTGQGHIRVWPYLSSQPNASFLNYQAGANLANAGVFATCSGCAFDLSVSTWFGSSHSLADVMGYFYPAPIADLADTAQGGYDLALGQVLGDGTQAYSNLATATFIGALTGSSTLTFNGGEEVVMRASGQISSAASATLDGTYTACYTDGTTNFPMDNRFYATESPFCTTTNANGWGKTVSVSGRKAVMPAGTYTFGICAMTGGFTGPCSVAVPHPGYTSKATKIEVFKFRN